MSALPVFSCDMFACHSACLGRLCCALCLVLLPEPLSLNTSVMVRCAYSCSRGLFNLFCERAQIFPTEQFSGVGNIRAAFLSQCLCERRRDSHPCPHALTQDTLCG